MRGVKTWAVCSDDSCKVSTAQINTSGNIQIRKSKVRAVQNLYLTGGKSLNFVGTHIKLFLSSLVNSSVLQLIKHRGSRRILKISRIFKNFEFKVARAYLAFNFRPLVQFLACHPVYCTIFGRVNHSRVLTPTSCINIMCKCRNARSLLKHTKISHAINRIVVSHVSRSCFSLWIIQVGVRKKRERKKKNRKKTPPREVYEYEKKWHKRFLRKNKINVGEVERIVERDGKAPREDFSKIARFIESSIRLLSAWMAVFYLR